MAAWNRRFALLCLLAACLAPVAVAAEPMRMSAADAHRAASNGEILLLDIRTRDEWRKTGIATSARAVSMHESTFLAKLASLTDGDKEKPVALICAVGGRSQALQTLLARLGYKRIFDVAEGMIGGRNGKGWIKSGLPVAPYNP